MNQAYPLAQGADVTSTLKKCSKSTVLRLAAAGTWCEGKPDSVSAWTQNSERSSPDI